MKSQFPRFILKKCLKQILCWTLSHLVRLWTAKQPTFSPTRKTKKCFHPDSLCFGQTFRPSTGSGPKAENQVIRLVIRIKTTHDVHFGNNVGEDLLGVCKFYQYSNRRSSFLENCLEKEAAQFEWRPIVYKFNYILTNPLGGGASFHDAPLQV